MKSTHIITIAYRLVAGFALALAPSIQGQTTQTTPASTRPATKGSTTEVIAGARATRDLRYGEATGQANLLDIYVPENAEGQLPLVVWIHGGGGEMGDKKNPPTRPQFTEHGYVLASINYRFSKEAIYPAQLQDCKGAIRWLRAHAKDYHIDPERVGVWGASAGGHFASLLGTTCGIEVEEGAVGGNLEQSSRVQAACDFFGPTDMSRFAQQAADDANMSRRLDGVAAKSPVVKAMLGQPGGKEQVARLILADSPLSRMFGGPIETHAELVARANPIRYIGKETPPFLIVHGDKDTVVPLAQSQIFADALKAAKVDSQFEVLAGAGHGGGFDNAAVRKMVLAFFDKHLVRAGAATQAKANLK